MKAGHQFAGRTNLIRAAYHCTRPSSYTTTGLTMYVATRYWTSGSNKVLGHSATILYRTAKQSTRPHHHYTATILTDGRTIYQASPFYSNDGRNKLPLNEY